MCEKELETEQRLQHIDLTSSSGHTMPPVEQPRRTWAAQLEAWGPALRWELVLTARPGTLLQNSDLQLQLLNRGPEGPLCWVLVLSTASYLQLTDFQSSPGLDNCSPPTFFLWASQIAVNLTRPRSRLCPDITRPCHAQVHFLFWQLGRVGGQYATHLFMFFSG